MYQKKESLPESRGAAQFEPPPLLLDLKTYFSSSLLLRRRFLS